MCPTLVRPCQLLRSLQRLGFLVEDIIYNAIHVPVLPFGVSACNPSCQAVPCCTLTCAMILKTQPVSVFKQKAEQALQIPHQDFWSAHLLLVCRNVTCATLQKASLAAPLQGATAALPRPPPARRRTRQEIRQQRERAGGGVGQRSGEPPAPARRLGRRPRVGRRRRRRRQQRQLGRRRRPLLRPQLVLGLLRRRGPLRGRFQCCDNAVWQGSMPAPAGHAGIQHLFNALLIAAANSSAGAWNAVPGKAS